MKTATTDLPARQRRRLERWLDLWEVPSLRRRLRVEVSSRLRRSFGRCYLERRTIRLTPSLFGSQAHLLPEILCHEAAHAAVYELYGNRCAPHGEEWQELMRLAGFEARVRIPVVVRRTSDTRLRRSSDSLLRKPSTRTAIFVHRCPRCRATRTARQPMRAWRCAACARKGKTVRLRIRRSAVRRT